MALTHSAASSPLLPPRDLPLHPPAPSPRPSPSRRVQWAPRSSTTSRLGPGRPGSGKRRRWEARNTLSPGSDFEVAIGVADPVPEEMLYELLPAKMGASESPFLALMDDVHLLDAILDGVFDCDEIHPYDEYEGESTPPSVVAHVADEDPDAYLVLDGCMLDAAHPTAHACYLRIPAALRPVFSTNHLSLVTVQALEGLLVDELSVSPDVSAVVHVESSYHRCIFHAIAAYYGLVSHSYDDADLGSRMTSVHFAGLPEDYVWPPCALVHVLLARPSARFDA